MKKLLIPLLIVLKLFKLKLLLFLPLILGLASFKKFLGFMALVVPGLIGFFKLCKPDLQHNYGTFGHSSYYHRPAHGGGGGSGGPAYTPYRERPQEPPSSPYREHQEPPQYLYESPDAHHQSYGEPYNSRPARNQQDANVPVSNNGFRQPPSSGSVSFKEDAHDMAYSAYSKQQ